VVPNPGPNGPPGGPPRQQIRDLAAQETRLRRSRARASRFGWLMRPFCRSDLGIGPFQWPYRFPMYCITLRNNSTTRSSDGTTNQRRISRPIKDGPRSSAIERQPTWWQINFGVGIRAWLNTLMSLLLSRQRSSTSSTATGRSLSDTGPRAKRDILAAVGAIPKGMRPCRGILSRTYDAGGPFRSSADVRSASPATLRAVAGGRRHGPTISTFSAKGHPSNKSQAPSYCPHLFSIPVPVSRVRVISVPPPCRS
jgi:hypothetical protein